MHQNMNVIRHHPPREEFVGFIVFMKQSRLCHRCDSQVTQMTLTNAAIQILLQLRAFLAVVFDLQQMFPLASSRFRHGIREAKGDELDQTGKITVRQIAALMPAKKTEGALFFCE